MLDGDGTAGEQFGGDQATVLVDGKRLVTGIGMELAISQAARGFRGMRTLSSKISAEVLPRNTGR